MNAELNEVENFLTQLKNILKNNEPNSFQLIPRQKNLRSLDKYGLSIKTVKHILKNLGSEHYFKGPCQDDKEKNDYCWWFFGKEINSRMFYIKVRIVGEEHKVICLSFHEAEYEISHFPYR